MSQKFFSPHTFEDTFFQIQKKNANKNWFFKGRKIQFLKKSHQRALCFSIFKNEKHGNVSFFLHIKVLYTNTETLGLGLVPLHFSPSLYC